MKFKLDENLPGEGVQILRAAGHDAVTRDIRGRSNGGSCSSRCTSGSATRTYSPGSSAGIVVLRLGRQSKAVVLAAIAEVAAAAVDEPVTGKLWIVEDGRLRIRG
jgi:hypothetical protein